MKFKNIISFLLLYFLTFCSNYNILTFIKIFERNLNNYDQNIEIQEKKIFFDINFCTKYMHKNIIRKPWWFRRKWQRWTRWWWRWWCIFTLFFFIFILILNYLIFFLFNFFFIILSLFFLILFFILYLFNFNLSFFNNLI